MGIGEDANAQTSFDDTQYILRVPADRAGILDMALTVLEDWAGGALFEPAAIERQRPIVLAEWRRNLGASERTAEKLRRAQLEGSRYADRTPIGIPSVIETAQREQLMRFYRDWYRPDLMAVIVVGDVDRNAVAAMIRQHFSSLVNPEPERPRPIFDVPERPGTRYAIVTDQESTNTIVSLSNLRPARNQGSVGGYRSIMKDQLFAQMLGDRLGELAQADKPPFLQADAGRGLFPAPRTRDQATLQALVPSDGITRGLEALVTELKRVATFGFTATELDRAKQANLAGYERVVDESPDRESSSRADEYTRNFLQREALPTIWQELAFHRRFLPEITLSEMNALAADWFPEANRLVIVSAPEVAGRTLPSESQLASTVEAAAARSVTAYVDSVAGQTFMERPPAKGSIVNTVVNGDVDRMDTVEWRHGGAAADDAEGGSDPVHGQRARRDVAGERRGFLRCAHCRRRDTRGRRREVFRRGPRQAADGEGTRGPAVHHGDPRGHARRQRTARPRDDVPVDVPALYGAARRSHGVRGHESAGALDDGRPVGEPGRPLQSDARLGAERQPSAAPARVAGHGGEMGSRQVARVLSGALRRRQQLHVRLRRQLHARDDATAGRNLRREPASHARP